MFTVHSSKSDLVTLWYSKFIDIYNNTMEADQFNYSNPLNMNSPQ